MNEYKYMYKKICMVQAGEKCYYLWSKRMMPITKTSWLKVRSMNLASISSVLSLATHTSTHAHTHYTQTEGRGEGMHTRLYSSIFSNFQRSESLGPWPLYGLWFPRGFNLFLNWICHSLGQLQIMMCLYYYCIFLYSLFSIFNVRYCSVQLSFLISKRTVQ